LEIDPQGHIIVRAPITATNTFIHSFVEAKHSWIEKKLAIVLAKRDRSMSLSCFTAEEMERLKREAKPLFEARAHFYAPLLGVTYNHITVRFQRSRWGSCSEKGNLSFNALLLLSPPSVLDYVVVHELCHRKEMNHSAHFWAEVSSIIPDWKKHRSWLRQNGQSLMARLPAH